jgi:hypothetical protein
MIGVSVNDAEGATLAHGSILVHSIHANEAERMVHPPEVDALLAASKRVDKLFQC